MDSRSADYLKRIVHILKDHDDPEMRKRAGEELVRVATVDSLKVLSNLITDPDKAVREAAGRACVRIGTGAVASEIARHFASDDPVIQRFVTDLLYRIGVDAIPALLAYASHPDARLRKAVVDTIAMLRDNNSLPFIVPMLHDESPDVVLSAVEALSNMADPASVPHLIAAFDRETYARNQIISALGAIGGKEAEEFLCDSFERLIREPDPDTVTLVEIVSALGSIGNPATFDLLGNYVQYTNGKTRHAMIGAMLWIAERSGLQVNIHWVSREDLIDLLNDPDLRVRIRAVQELATDDDVFVTKALVSALGSSEYFDVILLGLLVDRATTWAVVADLLAAGGEPTDSLFILLKMLLQNANARETMASSHGLILKTIGQFLNVTDERRLDLMKQILLLLDDDEARALSAKFVNEHEAVEARSGIQLQNNIGFEHD